MRLSCWVRVQVGIHELLGHGSGKLFHKDTPDAEALVAKALPHPISGEPITGPFYDAGTTWDSTFGKIASTCVHQRSISSSLVCRLVCVCGPRQRNPAVLVPSPG